MAEDGDNVVEGMDELSIDDDSKLTNFGKDVSALYEPQSFISPLSREQQASIFEILKCAVCLEVPRGKSNLQIKTCQTGHHFCMTCHRKLTNCAICRGRLYEGRNFAVEELISKMGPTLGISRIPLPDPLPPPKIPGGKAPCPHNCGADVRIMHMLSHIRQYHKEELQENLRSNPYTHRLDWMFHLKCVETGVSKFSLQVSDMGLMTIKLVFSSKNLRCTVSTPSSSPISSNFSYSMTICYGNSNYGINNSPVLGYTAGPDAPAFNVPASLLPEIGTDLQCFVYIKRTVQGHNEKVDLSQFPSLPVEPFIFPNDRKTRRNRNRRRRKKLAKKKGKSSSPETLRRCRRFGIIISRKDQESCFSCPLYSCSSDSSSLGDENKEFDEESDYTDIFRELSPEECAT